MKIAKINIKNFKNLNLVYEPTNVTAVSVGANGRGKTAFKEAIYAGITGDFPDNCIQNGKEMCSIEITLEDGTVFTRTQHRTKPNKVMVNGKTSNIKTLNEILSVKTGLSKDVMRIVASTDVLESLKPSEFGTFIMEYVPEKLDLATVESYIPGLTKKAEGILENILPDMPETFGLMAIENAYNDCVEQRKYVKKQLAVYTAKVDSFHIPQPRRSLADIDTELSDTLRKDGAQKGEKSAITMYEKVLENRNKAEELLKNLKAKIEANTAVRPVPDKLNDILNAKKEVQCDVINAQTLINTMNENIFTFKKTLENLDRPVCPISERLICTTDKTAAKDDIIALIKSNQEGIDIQQNILTKNDARIKELDKEEKEYRDNDTLYHEKVLLVSRYEEQKKNMPVLPEKPASATIVDYSWQIKELKTERDNALAWKQHLTDMEEQKKFQLEVETYEFLCAALNPKGSVVCKIIEYYLNIFKAIANSIANELRPGFEFKFIAENGVSYRIKTNSSKEWQTFETLSSGEQLMALFVLVDMLNQLTGANIMCLDDLDKLDSKAFADLMTLVQSPTIQDRYDHILLNSVNHKEVVNELKKYSVDWIYPI